MQFLLPDRNEEVLHEGLIGKMCSCARTLGPGGRSTSRSVAIRIHAAHRKYSPIQYVRVLASCPTSPSSPGKILMLSGLGISMSHDTALSFYAA